MNKRLRDWFSGDLSGMEEFVQVSEAEDASHEDFKLSEQAFEDALPQNPRSRMIEQLGQKSYHVLYRIIAVTSCVVFIGVMLYVIAHLSRFGMENPRTDEVARRYIESGLEETGATNIVAGMILDYRAFDTLGESHVLFTALMCVTMLLQLDKKNTRRDLEDYYTTTLDVYFRTSQDRILQTIGFFVVPFIMMFGIYVLVNGHLSPGGGFSGGAILGAGLIILSCSLGFRTSDRLLTARRLNILTFAALAFYSISKCYVFYTGANGLENHIPKGIPGAILSGGLILPLNVAVGLVVACTMYGFFSLFRRGKPGSD